MSTPPFRVAAIELGRLPLPLLLLLAALAWGVDGAVSASYQLSPRGIGQGGGAMGAGPYSAWATGAGGIGGSQSAGVYTLHGGYVAQLGVASPSGSQTLALSAATYTVGEASGVLVCTIQRSGGTTGTVSVPWTFSGGTAVAGVNVAPPLNGVAVLSPGQGTATIALQVLNDGLATGDLSIGLALGTPTGAGLAAPAAALVTISDAGATPPATARPRIVSQPILWATTGEVWNYAVTVDTRELPVGVSLGFSLVGAPAGMSVTVTGPRTAQVVWANPSGVDAHVRPVLVVTDTASGGTDSQDLLIIVRATPAGGG